VLERCQNLSLSLKSTPHVWIARKGTRKLFDGDTSIELAVSTG
jgi:hypothetical protein